MLTASHHIVNSEIFFYAIDIEIDNIGGTRQRWHEIVLRIGGLEKHWWQLVDYGSLGVMKYGIGYWLTGDKRLVDHGMRGCMLSNDGI